MSFDPIAVAAFVLFIGILIFVHELGHFLAAKYFGIKVLKFSLGFGPPLLAYTRGETTYQIALLPLGGFVKMLGELPGDDIAAEDATRALPNAPVYQRAVVAVAGPVFNLVFPVICFFAYYALGPTVVAPVVGFVEVDSPAERGGLLPGDRILEADGVRIWDFEDLRTQVQKRPDQVVSFTVERDGQREVLTVTPRSSQGEDAFGSRSRQGLIGVAPMRLGTTIGVDGGWAGAFGLRTGDRLLSADGQKIAQLGEFESLLRKRAPGPLRIVVARPTQLAVGELMTAQRETPVVLEGAAPSHPSSLRAAGIHPSDGFLRFLDPAGAAARAGIRSGDRVVSVDGQPVSFVTSFGEALQRAEDRRVKVQISRGGVLHAFEFQSQRHTVEHLATGREKPYFDAGLGLGELPRPGLTVGFVNTGGSLMETAHLGLLEAVGLSFTQTGKAIAQLSLAIGMLFTGGISLKTMGGPIMIYQVASQAAEVGIFEYLHLMAYISVNLGLINLLPIPLFDGGQLMFCAVEAIRRRPVSVRVREYATLVGLVLIGMLFVLVFSNDIGRLTVSPFK